MADYFTNISFAFECSPEQAEALMEIRDRAWENLDEIELPEVVLKCVTLDEIKAVFGAHNDHEIMLGDVDFELTSEGFWVHGSAPYLEELAELIRVIVKPDKPIGFEWSNDCTRHRLDAFGGGCCAIFKDRCEWMNTSTALQMLIEGKGND